MSEKFTPGDWEFGVGNDLKITVNRGSCTIAEVVYFDGFEHLPIDQVEANGHLIAAAPRMYKALYIVWEKILSEYQAKGSYEREVVEEALAQARGEK